VKQREGKKGSFLAIDNATDAFTQVIEAQRTIDEQTQGGALKIFCSPYGDVPSFFAGRILAHRGRRCRVGSSLWHRWGSGSTRQQPMEFAKAGMRRTLARGRRTPATD
jgi:hypothetical protein